jgi:hypothetical protein
VERHHVPRRDVHAAAEDRAAFLLHEFERYDVPRVSGVARREQLGALTVGLGLGAGR